MSVLTDNNVAHGYLGDNTTDNPEQFISTAEM
jgi:hypothetical protein